VRIGIHPEFSYCIFTLAFAGLAALGLQQLNVKDVARWGIALLIAGDLFWVGSGRPMNCAPVLEEAGLTRSSFDGSSELLDRVRGVVNRETPPARIDTMDASINWAEGATLTQVPAANGSSPLALENIVRLQLLALNRPGVRWGWYYQVENPDSPVLDVMNVKYLLVGPKGSEVLKARPNYRLVDSLPGNELFENLNVLPRYFLVSSVRQATDLEAERLIRSREADLHRTALITGSVPFGVGGNSTGPKSGKVRTLGYEPDSLRVEVDTPEPAFLVLSEAYYPGWLATIDDRPAEIYRTDIAFRGVVVPAGRHMVQMQFRPVIFAWARAISALALVVLSVFIMLRKRRIYGGAAGESEEGIKYEIQPYEGKYSLPSAGEPVAGKSAGLRPR
jgi:hypothetical protein